MTEDPVLIETSFADAVAIIAAAQELPEQKRRHWTTSLRQIAKAFDKPLEVIPARYSAVRADLIQLHEVPAGLTSKTLQNVQEQRKGRPTLVGTGKGNPRARRPLVRCMGGFASRDQRWLGPVPTVIVHEVLLGE